MKIFYLFALTPLLCFAAGSGNGDYDIIPRTVNFFLFAAILYYFIATPLKNFYKNRIAGIAMKLEEIQKKLLESKNKKLEMLKKLEDFKKDSMESIVLAKKEAEILANKVREETKDELIMLEKHFEEQKDYEFRKMEKEVINKILIKLFDDKEVQLSQKNILEIMLKKVS
ncbi:F0F1 ATP synthase subunit B [Campylobacter sp. US33a]|nr:F0F1 ATP synthase subunit B [Campylobacter sp. US33a]